jgi:PEP-CTERM motif
MRFSAWDNIAFLAIGLFAVATAPLASAANIAWVTFHDNSRAASAGAAGVGFTLPPDLGYTDLLTAAGHTVTRVLSINDPETVDGQLATINGYDLAIIGRSTSSNHYQQAGEQLFWNTGVTIPVITMNGYTARANRLGLATASTTPIDTTGDVSLKVLDPSHPIFAGIALDGTNTTVNPYAGIAVSPVDSAVQRGASIPVDPIAAGGTILATIGTATDPAFGGFAIAKWSPGATTTTAAANVLGGHRLAFIGGSREADGVSSETAGIFDLTDDGATMFLNAVDFMLTVPEPSSATLLLLAVAGFARRRSRCR